MMTKSQTTGTPLGVARITPRNHCPHVGGPCRPGEALCARLDAALALARPLLDDGFDLRGTVQVEDCQRRCLLAFRTTPQTTWCFGDVAPGADLDRLIADRTGACPGVVLVSRAACGPVQ